MRRPEAESSTAPRRRSVDLATLAGLPAERTIPGRNLTKADVRVVRTDAGRVAIKDYAARPYLLRHTLGRWLVARECAAYGAASGVGGLPAFHGRCGPCALALSWIEGTPLSELGERRLEPRIFDVLDGIVAALHERGIALGDLHHRDVLVGPGEAVHVVDLATAWRLGTRPGRIRRRVFERLRAIDRIALARLRARFTDISEDEAFAGISEADRAAHARARRLKAIWNRVRGRAS